MAEHDSTSTEAPDPEATDETASSDGTEIPNDALGAVEELRQELLRAIGDLRAELARLQVEDARGRLRQWIRENPALAVLLATGTGIVAGRLLTKALTPSPPPPLSERARRQAQALVEAARRQAREVGEGVSKQADRTRREAAQRAAQAGEQLRHQARDWRTAVSDRATSLREQAAEKARSVGASLGQEADAVKGAVAQRAGDTTAAIRSSAEGLADTADTVRSGYRAAKVGVKVAKILFALLVAKKGADWVRKLL